MVRAPLQWQSGNIVTAFTLIPWMGGNTSALDVYIRTVYPVYTLQRHAHMAVTMTSIRLDTQLADEAVRVLGAKSRTEAVHVALREIVALKRFKALMKKNSGKLKFAGLDE
jgi:Arc/MetJ family transcription regulator